MLGLLPLALFSGALVGAQGAQPPTSAGTAPTVAGLILDAVREAESPPAPETLRQFCATQVNVGGACLPW